MINIALTNLGKYNEGELVFKWLELPFDDDKWEETLREIEIDGEEYEEYFISDYETDIYELKISEYENIQSLNELAEEIEYLSENELNIAQALLEWGAYSSMRECLDNISGYRLDESITEEIDYAYHYVDEIDTSNMPDIIMRNIDYSSIADELFMDEIYVSSWGLIEIA